MNRLLVFEKNIVEKLMVLRRDYLLRGAVMSSILLTQFIILPLSLLFHGKISKDLVIAGIVCPFIVSLIVAYLLIILIQHVQDSEKKYRSIFENTQDVFYVSDMDGTIRNITPSVLKYTGYRPEELIGRSTELFYHDPCDRAALLETMHNKGEAIDYEVRMKTKDQRSVIVSINAHFTRDEAGKPVGIEGSLRDITERKRMTDDLKHLNEHLARQAATDALTGIANRMKFSEVLGTETLRSKRFGLPLSVIVFDVDHFKKINDSYGHVAGDNVLRDLAALTATIVRRNDLLARWGGEEFLIMVTHTELSSAVVFAERLRTLIEQFDFSTAGHLTCSFGVAQFVYDDTEELLINRADKALYLAKMRGRNRVEWMHSKGEGDR